MIQVEHLSKKIGNNLVLRDIQAEFHEGKIYGLVGRNGSGKTMLLRHMCGLVYPTEGRVLINGKEQKRGSTPDCAMGVIIEAPGFVPQMSGYRNLKYLADIRRVAADEQIKETMRLVGLDPGDKRHVAKYSLGMRQRLGIAQAIMEDPEILLLDEPLNGLDSEGVEEMRKVLLQQKEKGKLIVIASHSKEDIDLLCDEIIRFEKGCIVKGGD